MKLNVLFVANNIDPLDGGISTFIMNCYKYFDHEKIQIDFVVHTPPTDHIALYFKQHGSNIFYIDPFKIIKYRFFWQKFLKLHRNYNIVHIHSYDPAFLYLGLVKKTKMISIIHSHTTNMPKFNIVDQICKFNQFTSGFYADYFFGCSKQAIADRFGKNIANSIERSLVIPNGIETQQFKFNDTAREKIRRNLNISNETILIGQVGRFDYQKNQLFSINVFSCFHEHHADSKLILIGDGKDEQKIRNEINKYRLNDFVIILHRQNNISDYLSAFDMFLFPSTYEGFGIALLEAQCSGLHCFVSKEAIVPECDMKCNLLHRISLKDSAEHWYKVLLEFIPYSTQKTRYIFSNKVKENGYDLADCIKIIENFYFAHAKTN